MKDPTSRTGGALNRPLSVGPLSGDEPLRAAGKPTGVTLRDFWKWSASDLVSNATRGRLAEFIVARALGCKLDGVRDEWQAYDLETPGGRKVEVKSAAYIQSWAQKKPSTILFSIRKSREWNRTVNEQAKTAKRQADVYVFALLAHQDKATVDPLDTDQWQFYVLPTSSLDERTRSQHSITLKSLASMTLPLRFSELKEKVC